MWGKLKFKLYFISSFMLIIMFMCGSLNGCSKEKADSKRTINTNELSDEKDSTITQGVLNDEALRSTSKEIEEILSNMTLEQKVAQMLQGAAYMVTEDEMKQYGFGSILSDYPDMYTLNEWNEFVLKYQTLAMDGENRIPYLYGSDAVHGHTKVSNVVIFPHNIGIGAANNEELTYEMGKIVADEMKMSGMLWNFAPCLAAAKDPRWGRTYESYSSDYDIVAKLGVAFSKGLLENDIMPCAKHFIADGNARYGTGENGYLIDRGDAALTLEETNEILEVYQRVIDAGVQTVMVNHGSINGVKLHQHKELITDKLKGDMGFQGFVVSDWESIHNIEGANLEEKVVTSINAGIDMLMEPHYYMECYDYIIKAYEDGRISQERIDDAVRRIITVKWNMGLFKDPMQEDLQYIAKKARAEESREIARQLVEKSLILLKNDGDILPLKKGQKIFITGPAMKDCGVQSGGWTITWQGQQDSSKQVLKDGITILDGFNALASEYNFEITSNVKEAADADVTILCIGEIPYAEWEGDTRDLSITGEFGLNRNKAAIETAKSLGKPIVTLIVAGRNVLIDKYLSEWDAAVMCYLPGSEGDGVANVLTGKSSFEGKLPMPWYKSVEDIGTDNYLFPIGYGLIYK